ncbi:MAG TPA: glycoside hydrolase family 38 C-terminal domain-containing protein [Anaerolineales bacterium]
MRRIHLISHTHWDREWYLTFQQFRLRLVHLVDGLLTLLDADPEYRHFMLDGQTIVLDDYLQMRPEAEPVLRQHIQAGRLIVGPWHILPDMFLVGPEAHIRNLLEGDRQSRRFGGKMSVGYMPDSFGHIGQMPQILRGFGIGSACLWRGLDDQPTEFWWQSPDGSSVLMLYLRDSYSNGAALNASVPVQFTEQIKDAADSLASHSAFSDLLVMYGTDHMEPPHETTGAIRFANEHLTDYKVIPSTLPAYLASIQSQLGGAAIAIPTVAGELRSSKRSHLLPGVLSTRAWIKQRNDACENLLEKWVEPFSTFASRAAPDEPLPAGLHKPSSIVREAWRLLMECHPHDSICGCSIDQVHDEMRPRFDQVEQIGEEITRQSLEALASAVSTAGGSSVASGPSAIVVFNPSSAPRTDAVACEVFLPPGISDFEIMDESGNIIPHQSASGQTTDLINVRVRREELGGLLAMVHQGRAGNLAVREIHFRRESATLHVEAIFAENAEPNVEAWEAGSNTLRDYLTDSSIEAFHIRARSPDSTNITFAASNVPELGWKSYYVRAATSKPLEIEVTPVMRLLAPLARLPAAQKLLTRLTQRAPKGPYVIENECLRVQLDAGDATVTVTDKGTGRSYRGLNRFVDGGDCGDTYNFCPPSNDRRYDAPRFRRATILSGPVQQRMTVSLTLTIPAGLSEDRKRRSETTVELPITTTITLTNGVPRVDIHTRVDNRARDHRLRVHFPVPFAVGDADYDGHFEVVRRSVGVPPFDSTWIEEPRPEAPQRAFTSLTNGDTTLTVANRGLHEAEVLRGRSSDGAPRSEIAVTLLRCVGWLSRDDFSTRHGHAGPFLETPKAQMQGEWEFDYSIVAGLTKNASFQQAWNFQSALRAAPAGIHAGPLPAEGSFIRVDHASFVVTTVKETEDDRGWILRGYNVGETPISVTLAPWRRFARAERVNLAEQPLQTLGLGQNGEVVVQAAGHEIVTVLFSE